MSKTVGPLGPTPDTTGSFLSGNNRVRLLRALNKLWLRMRCCSYGVLSVTTSRFHERMAADVSPLGQNVQQISF